MKYIKKIALLVFLLNVLLFVAIVNADALYSGATSQIFVATNSNIQQILSGTFPVAIIKPDMWYRTKSGLWYYFENKWTTTRTGWFVDPRDGQTYYFRPENGIMAVGWTKIGDNEYYFYDDKNAESAWFEVGLGFYEKSLNGLPSYGSLFRGCMTPDGKMVDMDGKLIK